MFSKIRFVRFCSALLLMLSAVFITPQLSANDDIAEGQITAEQQQININDADAEAIARVLDGIGESRARAIVAYRDKHGPYKAIEELSAVKGVGKRTLEINRARIRLK